MHQLLGPCPARSLSKPKAMDPPSARCVLDEIFGKLRRGRRNTEKELIKCPGNQLEEGKCKNDN